MSIVVTLLSGILFAKLCRKTGKQQRKLRYKLVMLGGVTFCSLSIVTRVLSTFVVIAQVGHFHLENELIYNHPDSQTYNTLSAIKNDCPNATTSDVRALSLTILLIMSISTTLGYQFIYCSYWNRLNLAFNNSFLKISSKQNKICAMFLITMVIGTIGVNIGTIINILFLIQLSVMVAFTSYIIGSLYICRLMFKNMNRFIKMIHNVNVMKTRSERIATISVSGYMHAADQTAQTSANSNGLKSFSGGQEHQTITHENSNPNINANTNKIKREPDKQIQEKIYLMRRVTTLAIVTVVSTLILNVLLTVQTILIGNMNSLYYTQQSIDVLINVICLIMQFDFTDKIYDKCCFICSNCISLSILACMRTLGKN